jgi:hypothetical protein
MSDHIIKRLEDIASLRGPMAGNIIPTACIDAIAEIQQLKQQLAAENLELQRIRKVISDYCEIENHYSQAWDNDPNNAILLRQDWQNAWQALEDEALRVIIDSIDHINFG